MLAQLRVALRDVAAVLPLPVVFEEERTRRALETASQFRSWSALLISLGSAGAILRPDKPPG